MIGHNPELKGDVHPIQCLISGRKFLKGLTKPQERTTPQTADVI